MKSISSVMCFAVVGGVFAGGTNMLANAGFENGFASWREPKQAWRVEAGAGYNGTKGLKWRNDDPKLYIYPAQYVQLEPGAVYRLTALVKVDELKGAKAPMVGFEFMDDQGKWIGGAYAHPVDDNGILKDGWVRYEGRTHAMPTNVGKGGFLCGLPRGATGQVRFDDVSFEQLEYRTVEFLVSSAYRDTAGAGKVRFLAQLHADPAKTRVELAYFDQLGVARTCVKPVEFSAERAVFELDVDQMRAGEQTVTLTLRSAANGEARGSASRVFTRTDVAPARRVTFDSRRRMYLDGKKFFPLGHYTGYLNDADMAEYKKGPHNFAIQYAGMDKASLDRWQKAGVYVAADVRGLIYGYDYAVKSGLKTLEDSKRAFRKKYAEIGSHPALVMWYLNDEAPVSLVPNTTGVNDFLHELDRERATVTCLCHPLTALDFLPSYDVMAHDCYPIGNHPGKNMLERVTRQMRQIEGSMGAMRPLWFIPQTFDWSWCYRGDSLAKCDKEYLRMPTFEEMANMTWQGIACGANGVVSYSFSTIRRGAKGEAYEKAWRETCDMAREVKKMEEVLLADDFPVSREGMPEFVVARAWHHAGKDWYLVVNATRSAQTARVKLAAPAKSLATALGGGVKLAADGRALECDFKSMQYAFVSLEGADIR